MWWCYVISFFGGVLFGLIIIALMAASKEREPHEVHVYSDEDGNFQIMTFPAEDKVIWHNDPDKEVKDGYKLE